MGSGLSGAIVPRRSTESYIQAIPRVDGVDRHGKIHQLLIGEMGMNTFIDLIGYVIVGYQSDSFGPLQGSTFPFTVERCLSPGRQKVEALFTFTFRASIFRV